MLHVLLQMCDYIARAYIGGPHLSSLAAASRSGERPFKRSCGFKLGEWTSRGARYVWVKHGQALKLLLKQHVISMCFNHFN